MIKDFFQLFADIGKDIKQVFSSKNTYIMLGIILALVLLQAVVLWFGLKRDFVLGVSHGNTCVTPLANTKVLVAMFAMLFFVLATIVGVGETVNLLDSRPRSARDVRNQKILAIGGLTTATLIAIGSAIYVASWC